MVSTLVNILAALSSLFIGATLFTALYNFLTLPDLSPAKLPVSLNNVGRRRIAIIIPMRNEELQVQRLLTLITSIKSQWVERGDSCEIICIDDQSDDSTLHLLENFSDSITIINGKTLPQGWRGKNWANYQAAQFIHQQHKNELPEYLFFIDADISFVNDPFLASLNYMNEHKFSYLSPYPQEVALNWSEKLSQPLLAWSWMSTLPVRIADRSLRRSTVVANGQFLAIKTEAYFAIDGHKSIAHSVLDDMDLARELRAHKFHGTVVNGAPMISCRMYSNSSEIFSGYTKSLWYALGSLPATLFVMFWLTMTGVYPVIELFFNPLIGLALIAGMLATRYLTAFKSRSSLISPVLHPISATFLIGGIIASQYLHKYGRLQWKGRSI